VKAKPLCTHPNAERAPAAWGFGKNTCLDCARRSRTRAQQKYRTTAKGQATEVRYRRSAKGKDTQRRYRGRKIQTNDPRYRFSKQKAQAGRRGIPFLLTFNQWWRIWRPHWDGRGRRRGQLVMARNGDTGPYAVGNVEIVPTQVNVADAASHRTRRRAA
jgi:hypothetical protein